MKIFRLLIILIVVFITALNVIAQDYTLYDEFPGVIKSYKPAWNENYPDWAKKLYEYPVNYHEINDGFNAYMKEHPGEKSAIIRYMKIWRLAVAPYVLVDGTIHLPDIEGIHKKQKSAQLNAGKELKSASVLQGKWAFLGPKNTFWLNESNSVEAPLSCPWQANVYSFDVARTDNNILYCGTETGFVNKTTDKGLNWHLQAPGYYFGGAVTAIAIHPENANIVYVAAGKQIHKTTDGGLTWTPVLPLNYLFSTNRLKIDANNPEKIIAAASEGLFVSKNGGSSWNKVWSSQCWDVEFKPGDSNIILSITKDESNKFRVIVSEDAGVNFVTVTNFPIYPNRSGALLTMTPANPDIVYAAMLSSEGENDVTYIVKGTKNNGKWTWLTTKKGDPRAPGNLDGEKFNNGQGYFDLILEASPKNENVLLFGTCTLWKSTDGGYNFSRIGGYGGNFAIHPDIQDAKMLPSGETWVSTDGGMVLTTDNFTSTSNYFARINGLIGSQMWGFDQGWNEDIVVGGRYHNGNTAITDFYGDKALRMGGAESPTGWILQGKSRHVAFNDLGNGWILPKTAEGAPEGRFIFSKYPNMDEYGGRRGNLLHHPNYYNILYLGEGNGFWKSSDMGETFDLLYSFPDRVRYVQIAFQNPDVIYADVVNYGLYRSSDGGKSWQQKPSLTSSEYDGDNMKGKLFFAISPTNDSVIYACFQNGAWYPALGKVFRSEDGGDTWQNWTGTISEYTKCLVVQPDSDGKDLVYLFTNAAEGELAHVYYRNKGMGNWESFSGNYPNGMHVNLALPFYRDSKLRVGGNGGVWESPMLETNFKPVINFWAEKPSYNCMSDTLYFDDHSILNHEGAAWSWEITPEPEYISDANIRNPKVVLGQTGSYNVSLTVTQNGKTYSKSIENMVTTTTCPSLENCSNPTFLPQSEWKLVYADSEEKNYPGFATMAFDGDPNTIWHTRWSTGTDPYPHEIQIDLGQVYTIHEFHYLPRQVGQNGRINEYQLYISESGQEWGNMVKSGTFPNTTAPQTLKLATPVKGRYIRLKTLSEVNGGAWTSIAEINIVGCYGDMTSSEIIKDDNSVTAFPVPTDGLVNVILPSTDRYQYSVVSLEGKVVLTGEFTNHTIRESLDLNPFKPGIYFIRLTNPEGKVYRIKLIKK